jgi:retron-type reverse transcriptase
MNRFLKKGYIHFAALCDSQLELEIGAPQGSIVSPLVCNILLHELDCFMNEYINKYSNSLSRKRKASREDNDARNMSTFWELVCEKIDKLTHPTVSKESIRVALLEIQKRDAAGKGIKIQYIRYVDHFIIGLTSDKGFALDTLCVISNFSHFLGMTLNIEKSGVKHHENGTLFLGFKIYGNDDFNVKWRENKDERVEDVVLKFGIPLERLFERYADLGFFQKVKNKKSEKFVGKQQNK